ncbi:glutamate receptor ionotropic, kainate 4-like [Lycorma delicatula]|uniref:glutamate receptor ionotropic, kainate 4-like n=1 Tax=Lycorma delicatula TaxID=130591 RepID=UPI003F5187F3
MKYGGIYLYTYYPYTSTRCSDPGPPVFLDSWNLVDRSFVKDINIFAPKKVSNLQSCPLQCSGTHTPPDSIITIKGNNTYEFGGLGGLIFNFIAEHLNFTPVITRITDTTNSYEGVYSNDTSVLAKDILSRKVDIGFGKFSRSTDMHKDIIFAKETGIDCFTWAVPFRAGQAPSIWKTYVNEFYGLVWILISISLILAVIVLFILARSVRKERKDFKSIFYIILFIISTVLGSQLKLTPSNNIVRIFVVHWLLYTLVIVAAYQASLGSIVTVPAEIGNLQTIDEILDSHFGITGSPQMYYVLNASTSTTKQVAKLLQRFEVQPPGEFLPVMRRVVVNRNVVVFANQRLLMYSNSKLKDLNITGITAHVIPDCLLKSPSSPMLLRRGSPYRIPVDIMLNRLVESGIIEHWSALENEKEDNSNRAQFVQLYFRHLKGAFSVLLCGEIVAIFVFILEIISFKWFDFVKIPEISDTDKHLMPYMP